MRSAIISLAFLFPTVSPAATAFTQFDTLWVDGFSFTRPMTDSTGAPLTGTVLQVGFFPGLSAGTDPSTFGPAQWESFVPLSGDGSLNPGLPTTVSPDFPGFFSFSVRLNSLEHLGFPIAPEPNVLMGIRLFDHTSVDDARFYNTASAPGWILPAAAELPFVPFPGEAFFDDDERAGILVWESGDAGFSTTLPLPQLEHAPEPSTTLLGVLGLLLLGRRHR